MIFILRRSIFNELFANLWIVRWKSLISFPVLPLKFISWAKNTIKHTSKEESESKDFEEKVDFIETKIMKLQEEQRRSNALLEGILTRLEKAKFAKDDNSSNRSLGGGCANTCQNQSDL